MTNKPMTQNEGCEHDWMFDYQEFYDGVIPGYDMDVFHCRKCLERKRKRLTDDTYGGDKYHHKKENP